MTEAKLRGKKRLNRLVSCGLRENKDPLKYAQELKQLSENLEQEKLRRLARFFKALGDKTRVAITTLLLDREMCVCEIMITLGLTQPTASHHLRLLEQADILVKRKEGKWIFYQASNPKKIKHLLN